MQGQLTFVVDDGPHKGHHATFRGDVLEDAIWQQADGTKTATMVISGEREHCLNCGELIWQRPRKRN